ncbi:glycosyltransferase [Methanolobus sp. ZRKC3]|uniref:glycosyltransferase family 4 protein n=1 Tax=Methanolobus sp. ZRKC3 TaxID=3125786 RepID=UPI00324E0C55
MELIYYYPSGSGAPSKVSTSLFSSLVNNDKLPFDIKVFPQNKKNIPQLKEKYEHINIVSFKEITSNSKNYIVHIPMSPLVYPNRKFMLQLTSLFKKHKVILNYHGNPKEELKIKILKNHDIKYLTYIPDYFISPYMMHSAQKIVLNSNLMLNSMKSQYRLKNAVVIPNAIDNTWFEKTDSCEITGEPSIFYHGRLSPEKGVDILIKAFSKAVNKSSKASKTKLYIAGDGPSGKDLQNLVMKYNLQNNIEFLGILNQYELKSYLSSVDAAIYPSVYDAFSLAILEAFSTANGPVYYSKNAGINDFVLLDGYKFNSFYPTIDEICIIIEDLVNEIDKKKIISQQKKFAKKYTWDKVAEQYIELYKTFII